MLNLFLFIIFFYSLSFVYCHVFDQDLYNNLLDPELCQRQLNYTLKNDTFLLLQFLDAGIRLPKGILQGNLIDMGNYYQCLQINSETMDLSIEGKYCMLRIPLTETESPQIEFNEKIFGVYGNIVNKRLDTLKKIDYLHEFPNRSSPPNSSFAIGIDMAMCLPKPCTTREAINAFFFNITNYGFQYEDVFCRLPDDKLWVTGDTVAVVTLSVIGLLTILCTSYEIWYTKIQKKEQKHITKTFCLFSLYANTKDVLTFKTSSSSLDCLDGIRAISTLWVIVGHTYSYDPQYSMNMLDIINWITAAESLWITAAPICVDTFFLISGILIVYVTASKFNYMQLLKNIHFFYLNRLLRMFPLLAFTIFMQATLINHVADGPYWGNLAPEINRCRTYWWSTLLYVQNYVNPEETCIPVTWFLAIDMQLHILSPLLLFWVLGRSKRVAWASITCTLLASIAAATIYNFIKEFPSSPLMPSRIEESSYYFVYYYVNTLTRCSPYIIGMMLGYILHTWKRHQLQISKVLNVCVWIISLSILGFIIYCIYPTLQLDYENQILDSVINSFMRPAWAFALSWPIFACFKGYGGPINWFLSLEIWKLPARLSFAMYLLHLSVITIVNSSLVHSSYFVPQSVIFKFMGVFLLTMLISFVATVVVEQPFSKLIKIFLVPATSKVSKPPQVQK